jgi:hypothetical protein
MHGTYNVKLKVILFPVHIVKSDRGNGSTVSTILNLDTVWRREVGSRYPNSRDPNVVSS